MSVENNPMRRMFHAMRTANFGAGGGGYRPANCRFTAPRLESGHRARTPQIGRTPAQRVTLPRTAVAKDTFTMTSTAPPTMPGTTRARPFAHQPAGKVSPLLLGAAVLASAGILLGVGLGAFMQPTYEFHFVEIDPCTAEAGTTATDENIATIKRYMDRHEWDKAASLTEKQMRVCLNDAACPHTDRVGMLKITLLLYLHANQSDQAVRIIGEILEDASTHSWVTPAMGQRLATMSQALQFCQAMYGGRCELANPEDLTGILDPNAPMIIELQTTHPPTGIVPGDDTLGCPPGFEPIPDCPDELNELPLCPDDTPPPTTHSSPPGDHV